jgi:hypothetical protein
MNLLASCREIRQRVRNKKNQKWDGTVVCSTVTIRPSSDIMYTEHKHREELCIPHCLQPLNMSFLTQPETTMLSITSSPRLFSAPLAEESNKVTEMGGNIARIHQKNIYQKKYKTLSGRFEGKSPFERPRYSKAVAYPGICFGGGFNNFSWRQRTENGDLGAAVP